MSKRTVNELIAILEKLRDEQGAGGLPVNTQGCDCYGDAHDAEIEHGWDGDSQRKETYVLIKREFD